MLACIWSFGTCGPVGCFGAAAGAGAAALLPPTRTADWAAAAAAAVVLVLLAGRVCPVLPLLAMAVVLLDVVPAAKFPCTPAADAGADAVACRTALLVCAASADGACMQRDHA